MFHIHDWIEWQSWWGNEKVYRHEKTAWRYCRKCGESERKLIALDCTNYRRGQGWCDICAQIIEENPGVAFYIGLTYTPNMKMKGRKPNIPAIRKIKKLHDKGVTFRDIGKIMGIKDSKTVWFMYHYDLDGYLEKAKKYESQERA